MPEPAIPFSGRLVALVAAAAAAIALIGLVTGTSPKSYQAERPPSRERPDSAGATAAGVPPARSHAELARRPWGDEPTTSGWLEARALAQPKAAAEPAKGSVLVALQARAERRAFDGAPPAVPHPVRNSGAAECLACHEESFALGGRRASRIPHEAYASCMQCHVNSSPSFSVLTASPAAAIESSWSGLASPLAGVEAYDGAPPAVPHPTLMRERCESCHGADSSAPLRTPHPERRNCLQCHPATGGRGDQRSR